MKPLTAPADELAALAEGRAVVDLSSFRKVRVQGRDARSWLHDLVTTDVASLEPGEARRSLLLDPTGHIRADVQVAADDDGFWLLQDPDQPDHIGDALAPFVLSSDVRLDDLTKDLGLMSTGRDGADGFSPSVVGAGRRDALIEPGSDVTALGDDSLVSRETMEVWRIRAGRARMGADFDRTSIPAEVGLEPVIDMTKGCFLGQESVARVRNMGHPPRVLLHLEGAGRVDAGSRLLDALGDEVGVVTSAAARAGGGTVLLASVRWSAREGSIESDRGAALLPVGSLD